MARWARDSAVPGGGTGCGVSCQGDHAAQDPVPGHVLHAHGYRPVACATAHFPGTARWLRAGLGGYNDVPPKEPSVGIGPYRYTG